MPIKQSVCFPMMQPLPVPLDEFIPRVAGMGFKAIEIWEPDSTFEQLVLMAKQNGLVLASFSGHNSLTNGLNNPLEHERICNELRESIDLAAQFNVPGIICFSGNIIPGQTEDEAIDHCVQGLSMIAPYAEKKGVNLNLELLNSIVDHPGYQCDHSAWGLEVVQRVNNPRVKLLYDIYHMQIMEGNLIQTITENIEWIGHFHTAGVPGRNDIDDTQEINYSGVCQAISDSGYQYYLGHEYRAKNDLFESLRTSFAICNR